MRKNEVEVKINGNNLAKAGKWMKISKATQIGRHFKIHEINVKFIDEYK